MGRNIKFNLQTDHFLYFFFFLPHNLYETIFFQLDFFSNKQLTKNVQKLT